MPLEVLNIECIEADWVIINRLGFTCGMIQ